MLVWRNQTLRSMSVKEDSAGLEELAEELAEEQAASHRARRPLEWDSQLGALHLASTFQAV